MPSRFRISCFFISLAALSTAVWAGDDTGIQGTLRDTDGALLVAGDIRAERLDAKAKPVITKTDARGQYILRGLTAGRYRLTAYVDGIPRLVTKVQTKTKGLTKVDFNLHESQDDGVRRMQQDLQMSSGSTSSR